MPAEAGALPVEGPSWREDARPAALIAVGHAVSHFYQLAFAPLFPFWRDAFGLGWTQLGLIMTIFYAVSCLGQAAAGFIVDRHGPRRVLIGGQLLLGLGCLLASFAGSYGGLLVAATVMALGNSVFHPANYALLNERISERRIGHAYSAHAVSGVLGYASAPIVMTALAAAWGWREALTIAASFGFAMAVVVWWCRRDFSPSASAAAATDTATLPVGTGTFGFFNRALAFCMVFFVTVNIAGIGVQNMGASLLVGLGRMESLTAAGWITGYIISVGIGMTVGGFVASSRLRGDVVTGAGTLVAAALMLVIVLFPALGIVGTGLVLCLAGFSLGMIQPARDLLVRSAVSRASAGRAYGIVYAAVDVGAGLGPVVMGWWLDRLQPGAGFVTAAVFLALTAVAGVLINREVTRLRQAARPVVSG